MTRLIRLRQLALLLSAALIAFSSGCSIQKMAADGMAPVLTKTKDSFNQSSSPMAAREAAPGLLVTLDGILAASPDNEELLLLKAELSASFAFGFLQEEYLALKREDELRKAKPILEWTNELFGNARSAARRVLKNKDSSLFPVLDKGSPDEIKARLKKVCDIEDVPAVFWLAFSWGAYINLNREDNSAVMKDIPRVKALMGWVLENDETYFNGGAHLFFALLNLSLGKSIGGRPDVGLTHLRSVDQITDGQMLMSKVIYCEYYLPQVQTPEGKVSAEERKRQAKKVWDEYLSTLKGIMDSTEDYPQFRLQNAVAKLKAEELYYRADDVLFPPPGEEAPVRPGEEDDEDYDDDEDDEDEDEE